MSTVLNLEYIAAVPSILPTVLQRRSIAITSSATMALDALNIAPSNPSIRCIEDSKVYCRILRDRYRSGSSIAEWASCNINNMSDTM